MNCGQNPCFWCIHECMSILYQGVHLGWETAGGSVNWLDGSNRMLELPVEWPELDWCGAIAMNYGHNPFFWFINEWMSLLYQVMHLGWETTGGSVNWLDGSNRMLELHVSWPDLYWYGANSHELLLQYFCLMVLMSWCHFCIRTWVLGEKPQEVPFIDWTGVLEFWYYLCNGEN